MDKKKVLIIGNSAKEYALAKKMKNCDCEVVVLPGNSAIKEIAKCIDIREENVQEILEYVLENAIDLTIVSSEIAIKNDIANLFQANNQPIFCPTAQSAQFALSRSAGKRFLYKQRISTPRFGIFDKLPLAIDYLKTASMPQVIRADENSNSADRLVCTTFLIVLIPIFIHQIPASLPGLHEAPVLPSPGTFPHADRYSGSA